ncbi:MAG: phosphoadenosine phosphosulfate reductase family protein [Burkholderiaceae bacterium]|nr:phosphoadenosine phosphosulfate reductase family protein [Burkholderiaceae bacterium]
MNDRVFPVQLLNRHFGAEVPPVAMTPEIASLLARDCVVAVGVSGGKDSDACAIAVNKHLNEIGHSGHRLLVHSDLGRIEWTESLPQCERLAAHLGWELLVVRRQAGDMMDRWQGRWKNNVARYADLSCVKLILPWSPPSMRFCTSELKAAVISSALKKRFPGQHIVNVAGIRREESDNRAKAPVSKPDPRLDRKGLEGQTWNAVIEFSIDQVLGTIASSGLALHEGYSKYGMSRISCAYCIMSSEADLMASAGCVDNHEVYIELVELEAESTFAFQGNRWLADVAPHLLPRQLRAAIVDAKEKAVMRQRAEARIPKELLYTKGWPTKTVTAEEAHLIACVRNEVANTLNLKIGFTTADEVAFRYSELINAKAAKDAVKVSRFAAHSGETLMGDGDEQSTNDESNCR